MTRKLNKNILLTMIVFSVIYFTKNIELSDIISNMNISKLNDIVQYKSISSPILTSNALQLSTQRSDSWLGYIEQRFNQRRRLFAASCQNISSRVPLGNEYYWVMQYQKKYNLLLCCVPKAGHTTMMVNLKEMTPHQTTNGSFQARNYFSPFELETSLYELRKILLVRHPLDRLVSAYEEKVNRVVRWENKQIRAKVNKFLGHRQDMQISFTDFLNYVIDLSYPNRVTKYMDAHWANYSSVCALCTVPYDYIMKTETLNEDLLYIKETFNISEIILGKITNKSNASHNSSAVVSDMRYWQYYVAVPSCVLQQVLALVHQDLLMFDYQLPREIMEHAARCAPELTTI